MARRGYVQLSISVLKWDRFHPFEDDFLSGLRGLAQEEAQIFALGRLARPALMVRHLSFLFVKLFPQPQTLLQLLLD